MESCRCWLAWRRLGFITDFLSKPILVGYIFGATLIVIGSQLGKMFGISLESDKFFQQVLELISRLDEAHLLTFVIGVVCMAALFIMRRVNPRPARPTDRGRRTIILSVPVGLGVKGVKVVGAVPAGLPQLTIPRSASGCPGAAARGPGPDDPDLSPTRS